MKQLLFFCSVLASLLIGGSCKGGNDSPDNEAEKDLPGVLPPSTVIKSNPMKVYVHYMPWFETPQSSGKWGQHWTMSNCNPDKQDANGKREIASFYYPLIGPYASSDATVLNYHALLMKYSGVDGIMIDWYGTQDKNNYPQIKHNTEELVKAIERVELNFSIVYEDATLSGLDDSDKQTQAQADLKYLGNNFFKSKYYTKIENQPLLMIFGPQQITSPESWKSIFSNSGVSTSFIVLNGFSSKVNNTEIQNAIGEFLWVNPKPDYSNSSNYTCYIGGAMPGFHDYYQAGGWGDGYPTYDSEDGTLFNRQLDSAQKADLEYLQISTWNDFGEGTNIEPTLEYGYQYLKSLQTFTGTNYGEENLEAIYHWYELKQKYVTDEGQASEYLTQAFYYFIALEPDKAIELMNELK